MILTDKAGGKKFSKDFEEGSAQLQEFVKFFDKQIKTGPPLMEALSNADIFYEMQYKEVKIVANVSDSVFVVRYLLYWLQHHILTNLGSHFCNYKFAYSATSLLFVNMYSSEIMPALFVSPTWGYFVPALIFLVALLAHIMQRTTFDQCSENDVCWPVYSK